MKTAPTCFGLQGNHHQGATTGTWLKIQAWFSVDTDVVQTYYAAITLTTSVSTLNQACIFSQVPVVAPDDGFLVNRNMLEQFS